MPNYDYHCPENGRIIEVFHQMVENPTTWRELCELSGEPIGNTPPGAVIARIISAPGLSFPKTNSALKNMGFTKLVRRDSGVYENVTATGKEARFVNADQPSTFPDFKKKIAD